LSPPIISESESRSQAVDDFLSLFPSDEAEAAAEELRLEEVVELADRAVSLWGAVWLAAGRGDANLVAMHLRQIVLIIKAACLTVAEAAL
jgi:hypothetical protein